MPPNPNCTRCPLHLTTSRVCVPGHGPTTAKIMLIGEAPGAEEERGGIPFSGAAGNLLNQLLRQAGLKREDIYTTNVARCRPPGNRDPTAQEADACFMYLAEEIEQIHPKVIVALGNVALKLLTGKNGITAERGKVLATKRTIRTNGATVMATFHPAALLHRTSPVMRDAIIQDFTYASKLAGITAETKLPPHTMHFCFPDDAADDVQEALQELAACKVVSVDCEWTAVPQEVRKSICWPWTGAIFNGKKPELYSISISGKVPSGTHSVGIALPQFKRKREVLRSFFKNHPAVFHNAPADLIWLYRLDLGIRCVGDSMQLFHSFDETQRVNLEQLCMLNLGMAPWKGPLWDERPKDTATWKKLLRYNCQDVYATLLLNEEGWRQLKARPQEEADNLARLYTKVVLPRIPTFVEIAHTGVPLDEERILQQIAHADVEQHKAAVELSTITGMAPARAMKLATSPAQTTHYLNDVLGAQVHGSTKGDLADLSIDHPIVKHIQSVRYWAKRKGTYLEPWYTLGSQQGDWRLHSVYRLTASRTGRTSAEVELGGSLQLAPRDDIKTVICAPPGRVLLSGDYSNVEMRIGAWFANEQNMIQLFKEGADLHKATAAFIRAFQHEGITIGNFWPNRQQYMASVSPEDRQAAKGVNFGLLFGMAAPKLMLYAKQTYNTIFTLEQAEAARNGYFSLYPGLARWHAEATAVVRRGYTVTPFGRYRRVIEDERKALNTPVQSTASELTTFAMQNMWAHRDAFPCEVLFCGFVHDSIVLECDEVYAEEVATVMQDFMEHPPLERVGIELPVPLAAEVKWKQALG